LAPGRRGGRYDAPRESAGSLARRVPGEQGRGTSVTAPRPRPTRRADQAVTWMLSPGFITCTFTLGAMAATARRNSSPAWMPITWGLWA
jgi:hypothetical protein